MAPRVYLTSKIDFWGQINPRSTLDNILVTFDFWPILAILAIFKGIVQAKNSKKLKKQKKMTSFKTFQNNIYGSILAPEDDFDT